MEFEDAFRLLTGNMPFPWQRALFTRFLAANFPNACDLPTGLGKTSVLALWLIALSHNPALPRRLIYVVNRRTVVDQSTTEAERLRTALLLPAAEEIRHALSGIAATESREPLAISTLRGEFADNGEWRQDPSRPAIVIGTVDMIGSRLLFSGYGLGFRSRPQHAGFLGHDALLVHDEAHLEPAFQALASTIAREQQRCREPRPLRVIALSATSRVEPDFSLGDADNKHDVVRKRIHASKGLLFHEVATRADLPDRVAEQALRLKGKVAVFLSSVDHAEKCAQILRKTRKDAVVTLTGTLRGAERDTLAEHPAFAAFLPSHRQAEVPENESTVHLVATSAGEVGIDISADHLVTDLPPYDALAQRLGRVNRYGEGTAVIHVFGDPLKSPPAFTSEAEGAEEGDDRPGNRTDEYEHARFWTRALIDELPLRNDGLRDASPAALRALDPDSRAKASTPIPDIHPVDELLFDRWSFTTITGPLPGRPAVAEWLHGKAEWEPPRTTIAWRTEVAWLTVEHLGVESLDDLLSDYPLRSRETLSDITSRVFKHLEKLAARPTGSSQLAWLVRHDRPGEILPLASLVESYDPRRNPSLEDATVVLPPTVGGLASGLLDGSADFDSTVDYDLGPRFGERVVLEDEAEPDVPAGMRLARSIRRTLDEDGEARWWHLFVALRNADDEGSRNSRRDLLLDVHLRQTEAWAYKIAEKLGLSDAERRALAAAGRAHDLGKRRRVWQRSIRRFQEPALAKGPMRPTELGHYRHELGSLHDGDFTELDSNFRDLALHVVAAHHGRARPHFPSLESFDPELRDDIVAAIVHEVPMRFDRLQLRYGRWGLAWLESILRAADILGSGVEVDS